MGKRRYLVGFNIRNELAKTRIMNDPDLANLITGDGNSDDMVIIKGGLKAKEVLDTAQFLSSALTITCCRIDDDTPGRNSDFNEDLRYCMHDLMGYAEEFDDGSCSARGFKRWFKDCIVKCQYNRYLQGYKDFDENIVRVYPVDITELDEVAMFFGYDVVKEDEDNE